MLVEKFNPLHSSFHRLVFEQLEAEYRQECLRLREMREYPGESSLPFIGDLCEKVHQLVYTELKLILIEEAIRRHEYEWFSTTANDFWKMAWKNEINDPALQVEFTFDDIQRAVQEYLWRYRLAYIDYDLQLQNYPVKEVW